MIGLSALTVFVLGLRHGADPDHLAAIDNVTRSAYARTPALSRFAGTLFAGGHSVMVLAISALVGMLGTRLASHGALLETIGTWVSIVVLLAIATLNMRQLLRGGAAVQGVKARLLPARLRNATSALVAVPIGLLFGFGFETSSQIATYAIALGAQAGILGALLVGTMFCAGMVCTDTMDSLLVHRLVGYRVGDIDRLMRVWLSAVTALAFGVAFYELAQMLGWRPPVSDIVVSAVIVASLLGVFAYVVVRTRAQGLAAGKQG